MHIFADGFTSMSLLNNNLRITLVQGGPDNKAVEAGVLIMPISQAVSFVNGLANGIKKLDEQIKTKTEQPQGSEQ